MNQNNAEWQQKLQERGILEAALEAGWEQNQNGWKYPICGADGQTLTHRWKAFDSNYQPKYRWIPNKPGGCDFYLPPGSDITTAIAEANGKLFIASGEPDLLTFFSAGIRNVICWFGETSVPSSLLATLQAWDVTEVVYFPDRDDAGRNSARKVAEALQGSEIVFNAHHLPDTLGDKGDINILWIACEFDRERFITTLNDIQDDENAVIHYETTLFTQPTRSTHERRASRSTRRRRALLPQGFYDAIERALGVQGYKSNGWSYNIICPFHDDHNPSAGWHKDYHILKCHACSPPGRINYRAEDVGEQLGIDYRDYYSDQTPRSTVSLDAAPTDNDPEDNISPTEDNSITSHNAQEMIRGAREYNDMLAAGQETTATHDVVGDALIEEWKGGFAWLYEKWHHYNNGYWHRLKNVDALIWAKMKAFKHQSFKPTKGAKNSVKEYLESQLYVDAERADQGDQYINLRNGLLNLETYELEEHDPDLYLTSQLPFEYDPDAECPHWLACLDQWLVRPDDAPDTELIALLQEAIGYSLTADTHHEKAFLLYGPASSGKSTVLKVIQALAGDTHLNLDLNNLNSNQYQLAQLPGKRVVTCSEALATSKLHDSLFKQLVSGECMMVRPIYQAPFEMIPQAKVFWAANELPDVQDRSNAVYRRLAVLPFLTSIPDEQKDRHLIEKLHEEISGIFNWALEGLKRLETNGDFTQAERSKQAVEDYKYSNDVERQFIDEECVTSPDYEIRSSDLYRAYKSWCEVNGHRPKSSSKIAKEWERLGFKKAKRRDGNYWTGVAHK